MATIYTLPELPWSSAYVPAGKASVQLVEGATMATTSTEASVEPATMEASTGVVAAFTGSLE